MYRVRFLQSPDGSTWALWIDDDGSLNTTNFTRIAGSASFAALLESVLDGGLC